MARKYFHVTSAENRGSIEEHGLDWRRMGATHGIAGVAGTGARPEVDGIFLLEDESEIEWFAHIGLEQGHKTVDVWEVSLPEDAEFAESAEGYQYVTEPIPPDGIRLYLQDWASRDPAAIAGDFFQVIYYGDGKVDTELLDPAVRLTEVAGDEQEGHSAVEGWATRRAHGSPAPPTPGPDGVIRVEISNSSGYSIEGLSEEHVLVSPESESDRWTVLRVNDNRICEIREYEDRSDVAADYELDET